MKCFVSFVLISTICLSSLPAAAHDKVVVIPLNAMKKLHNVVTVSAKGGDFTDPVAAVQSIIGASAENPYLVVIGPGVYTSTQTLTMKPHVTIAGSGQGVTKLTGAISSDSYDSSSALVYGVDNAILHDLTVENTGGGKYAIALLNEGSSPVIQNVTATASGGIDGNYGVFNASSSPKMTDVTATAIGGTYCYGVYNQDSSPTMTGVIATATGTPFSLGVYNQDSSPIIRQCILNGTTLGIWVTGAGTTRVIQSSITGGRYIASGTLTCVNSDNGVAAILSSSCN